MFCFSFISKIDPSFYVWMKSSVHHTYFFLQSIYGPPHPIQRAAVGDTNITSQSVWNTRVGWVGF